MILCTMFPWRSVLSIVSIALLFALYVSEFSHRQVIHPAKRITRRLDKGASLDFFRIRPPVTRDQLQYNSGLNRRDVCNDAFPGRYSQTCSPSRTLCCIIPNASRPACTNILGFGFCCTEHTDCFVDTDSACNDTGSEQCAPGLCCPARTNCVDNFNYTTESLVRCNVNRNLIPGYTSSSSSSIVSSTVSPTTGTSSGTVASATSDPTSAVPTNIDGGGSSSSLSGGAIAGIAIGAVAAVALWAIAGWLLYRRRQQKKEAAGAQSVPVIPYQAVPQEMSNDNQIFEAPNGVGFYGQQPKETYAHAEMPTQERRQELP